MISLVVSPLYPDECTLQSSLCLTLFSSSSNSFFPTWKHNIQNFQFCFLSRVPTYSIDRNTRVQAGVPRKERWACAELFSREFLCWTDTVPTRQMHHTCHRGLVCTFADDLHAQWHLCEAWPEGLYRGCSLAGTLFGASVWSGALFGGKHFGSLFLSSFTVDLNQLIICWGKTN